MRTVERNALVEQHLPMVRRIARKLSRSVDCMEYEDLVQEGVLGLLDACERFDLERVENPDNAFVAYASMKIRGAMLDRVRTLRAGTRTYHPHLVSLDEPAGDEESPGSKLDYLRAQDDVENEVVSRDECSRVRGTINLLSKQQRVMIWQHYFCGKSIQEVGKVLAVGKDRSYQIHQDALRTLRALQAAA